MAQAHRTAAEQAQHFPDEYLRAMARRQQEKLSQGLKVGRTSQHLRVGQSNLNSAMSHAGMPSHLTHLFL